MSRGDSPDCPEGHSNLSGPNSVIIIRCSFGSFDLATVPMWFENLSKLGYKISLICLPLSAVALIGTLFETAHQCIFAQNEQIWFSSSAHIFALFGSCMALLAFHRSQSIPEAASIAKAIRSGTYDFPIISAAFPFTLAHLKSKGDPPALPGWQ